MQRLFDGSMHGYGNGVEFAKWLRQSPAHLRQLEMLEQRAIAARPALLSLDRVVSAASLRSGGALSAWCWRSLGSGEEVAKRQQRAQAAQDWSATFPWEAAQRLLAAPAVLPDVHGTALAGALAVERGEWLPPVPRLR